MRASALTQRIVLLIAILSIEAIGFSLWLDGASLAGKASFLTEVLATWGAWLCRWVAGSIVFFATFASLKAGAAPPVKSDACAPPGWLALAIHVLAMICLGIVSANLYGAASPLMPLDLLVVVWAFTGLFAVWALCRGMLQVSDWRGIRDRGGALWWQAPIVSAIACAVGILSAFLWRPVSILTFWMVRWLLTPFVAGLVAQPEIFRIATPRFGVIISSQCSGLEGIGLILLFGCVWMIFYRRELRFPNAFAILPVGIVSLFALNSIRIAALLMIGHFGAKQIAAGGFHSQAGWIAFNLVAFSICLIAAKVPWLWQARQRQPIALGAEENAVAPYLGPFLMILIAAMISTAMSAHFEWLYGLRMAAAGATLWAYRRIYRTLNWKLTWWGPGIGLAVFLLWVGAEAILSGPSPVSMPVELSRSSGLARFCWIMIRTLTAIAIVPVCEELAFRGYLLRRLVAEDFEVVGFERLGGLSIALSSLCFGLMHGERWLVGTIAGVLFALAIRRRGSMADAVGAHAVANALLAACVLIWDQWRFW